MESTIPEISSASWSSIITGKNPGEHGIYGFTELIDGTYTMSFPNFNNLKAPPFWKKDNKKYVIINVPSTYPAQEINGFLVSGFVALDLEKAVFPSLYIPTLQEMKYQIDVDSNKAHKSISLFLTDLFKTLETRINLYRYLWEKIQWNLFMLVFTGTDRIGHFLWNAYENSTHQYHNKFLKYFQKIDDAIGEIKSKITAQDSLIILSDHGMEKIHTNVNINTYLEQNNLLTLNDTTPKKYKNISEKTKAFAMEPARIYINKKGRYPRGLIHKNQQLDVINELKEVFNLLKQNGNPIIRKIYTKDEIYHGKYLERAPDMVLLPQSGYCLRGNIGKKDLFEQPEIITGSHTQPDAFLYVKNKENTNIVPVHPTVEHILSIIDQMNG
jgi:predicted AlkP superfamily phosphohydrolase/phosphomutase